MVSNNSNSSSQATAQHQEQTVAHSSNQPKVIVTRNSVPTHQKTHAAALAAARHLKLSKQLLAKQRGQRLAELAKTQRATGKPHKKSVSKSKKAGLYFPIARTLKQLRKLNPHRRLFQSSGVFLAGVIEYLIAELLELSGDVCTQLKRRRISPRHLFLAIEKDDELNRLLKNVTLSESGRVPHIHPELLKKSSVPLRILRATEAAATEPAEGAGQTTVPQTESLPPQQQPANTKRKSTSDETDRTSSSGTSGAPHAGAHVGPKGKKAKK